MSAFDIKQISDRDAFKLEEAKREETPSLSTDPNSAPPAFDPEHSPVSEVVREIMSHWAETDEKWVKDMAEATGDSKLKKVVGEAAMKDTLPGEGMAGNFNADTAGPEEGIEVPPLADGGEFGGGGGGGGGGADGADMGLPAWMQGDDGGMADPGDMPDAGVDQPGFAVEGESDANYGGGGGGDGEGDGEEDEEPPPPKPDDPKKPKKP